MPDARHLSDEGLEALRLPALRGCERGFTAEELAQLLGVARETLSRWWSAYADGGVDALPQDRTGRPVGSGRVLSDSQAQQSQQLLDNHQPEDLGIAAPLWTRRAVVDRIRKHCDLDLPVRTVGDYRPRWGDTAKRSRRRARQQDPEEVRDWLEEIYPALERKAQQEDADIHWCDETAVAADEHPACGYAGEGEPATMLVPGPPIRMNQISTITNAGTVRFMTYAGTMNTALFLVFLGRLLRSTTKKVFRLVDRLRAQEGPTVEAWVATHQDRIELFSLPRYAPELNADEYLNHDLKANVNAESVPNNNEELRSRMQRFMHKLIHLPAHVKSYFQHPYVMYTMGLVM